MTAVRDDRGKRRAAWFRGLRAERIACLALCLKGYGILARRHKTPVGEIDIIARRGSTLVFVEVKARATEQAAVESASARQRRRITRAAEAYIRANPRFSHCTIRFDVIGVVPWRWPVHVQNAWQKTM